MRPHEVESWVLNIIDQLETGQPIEDSRVELKSEWIDSEKAARRIAGHANAARGAPILWIIGADEKSGVVSARHTELANWWAQVKGQFDGLAPAFADYNIPVDDKIVVALLFETDRAPFVVKNPAYGKPEGGPVSLEVPWREGTSIRSATRADLLRLLSPLQTLPQLEVLEGYLSARKSHTGLWWSLSLALYVETVSRERTVIPFHRCEVSFEVPEVVEWVVMEDFSLRPLRTSSGLLSATIGATPDEILINGPGIVTLEARLGTPSGIQSFPNEAHIVATLLPVGADHPVTISATLPHYSQSEEGVHQWSFT